MMKPTTTPHLPFSFFLELLTYSALCAFWEYEHICFDGLYPPPQLNLSLLPAVHFGLSPSLRAMQTTPLVHIMWMSRTQALPYCSLRFWPCFLQCEAAMSPKDDINVASVLFTESNAQIQSICKLQSQTINRVGLFYN